MRPPVTLIPTTVADAAATSLAGLAFEAAPTPLLIVDADHTILSCNQLARDWLDCRPGRSIAEGLADIDLAANTAAMTELRRGAATPDRRRAPGRGRWAAPARHGQRPAR